MSGVQIYKKIRWDSIRKKVILITKNKEYIYGKYVNQKPG